MSQYADLTALLGLPPASLQASQVSHLSLTAARRRGNDHQHVNHPGPLPSSCALMCVAECRRV
jgi:hypothetical protein